MTNAGAALAGRGGVGSYRRILLATDFSSPSREAFLAAVQATRRDGAKLLIVHVAEGVLHGLAKIEPPNLLGPVAAESNDLLDYWKDEARQRDVGEVETCKLEGIPWREIVDLAARERVDAIFVGTHGRTGLKHALLGSVAEKIVGHAPCSVVVVRPPVRDFQQR